MYIRPNFTNKNESLNILLSIYADSEESQGEVGWVFTGRLQNAENGGIIAIIAHVSRASSGKI